MSTVGDTEDRHASFCEASRVAAAQAQNDFSRVAREKCAFQTPRLPVDSISCLKDFALGCV
jgi:hypothetical protein